jgi:hypothetical protein
MIISGSKLGYLMFDNYFVNMDTMIPNPSISLGEVYDSISAPEGPKINKTESIALK